MTQRANRASLRPSYDYVIVGAGAAGCVLASELSASGADVLLIESGGTDDAPTVLNPSVWFYNAGGALDYSLQVHKIQDKDTAGRLCVDYLAQLVHIVGVKLTADREHNRSAAGAMNFQHRPRCYERNYHTS